MANEAAVKAKDYEVVCPSAQFRGKCSNGQKATCRICGDDVFISTCNGRLIEYDLSKHQKGILKEHSHPSDEPVHIISNERNVQKRMMGISISPNRLG